jgi:tetratricopeptide (TPR) repeat protein
MVRKNSEVNNNDSKKVSKKKVPLWYYLVLIIIPVAFILIVEVFLRVINYGTDFTTFKPISSYYPDKLFLNPDLPYKYFSGLENIPHVLPDGFDLVKKDNAFRVFVIGGSTTAGWPYVPNASFPRHLKRRLEIVFPYNIIEVINCGVSAINSYTLRDIVPGILKQQPDLILFYAGHNEYYGALGPGSSVSLGNSPAFVNLYLWLKDFRITQLVENIIAGIYGVFGSSELENRFKKSETLMSRMIGESLITLDSETYFNGIDQFRINLQEILEDAKEAGIRVIIGTLTSNTKDLIPFISQKTEKLPGADEVFKLATAELEKGNLIKADSLFTYAKELDALRFRAPEMMNIVIRELADGFDCNVVEIDSAFRKNSKDGIVGYNLTVDHLHPNIEGYNLMAKEFFRMMDKLGHIPDSSRIIFNEDHLDRVLAARFPFTRLDSTISEMQIIQLTGTFPFVPKGTPNYKKLNFIFKDFVDSLALNVINKDIKWEMAHSRLADKYFDEGNYDGFIKEMNTIIQERPYFDQPYIHLISRLVDKGITGKALPYLRKLYSFKPSYFATKWLGQILLYKKQYAKALKYLKEASEFSEADSQTWYNLAGAYSYNNQIENALTAIKKSVDLNPNNQQAKNFFKNLLEYKKQKKPAQN